jgi:hypothetical protein
MEPIPAKLFVKKSEIKIKDLQNKKVIFRAKYTAELKLGIKKKKRLQSSEQNQEEHLEDEDNRVFCLRFTHQKQRTVYFELSAIASDRDEIVVTVQTFCKHYLDNVYW